MQDKVMLSMESRMRGNMQVRFGGRYEETYCRKAARRLVPSLRLGIGGDIFNLAGEFIHSRDFLAQARFISESAGVPMVQPDASTFRKKTPEPSFEDVEVLPLRYQALKKYLVERGISPDTASFYCCQLDYYVHKKKYFAVGFSNVSGGYELRNRLFKGCIPPKDVSLIKRKDGQAESCSLYEGFMDFLSAVTLGMAEDGDSLVLNSVANVDRSFRYLDGYERIRCYLDNDEAGHRTVEKLRMRYGEKVSDCRGLYKGCKDLNEYLQQRINKQNNNKLKIR